MTMPGPTEHIPASEIVAGDWTLSTGFRRVSSVEHVMVTSGRGKNRSTYLARVELTRSDGAVDVVDPYQDMAVRRMP